jgi:hypothetical protein
MLTLTTSLALFLSAVTLDNSSLASTTVGVPVVKQTATVFIAIPEEMPQVKPTEPIVSVEQYVKAYFADAPIMAQVSRCESQYRQFTKDGALLRGRVVKEDVGVMQINETYHLETSRKLGYDIHTLDGNLAYGRYLYEKQGTQPWNSSKPCWGWYE